MSSQASDNQQFYPEMAKLLEAGTRLARMAAGEEAGTWIRTWRVGDVATCGSALNHAPPKNTPDHP
jgi:hypothetical protein